MTDFGPDFCNSVVPTCMTLHGSNCGSGDPCTIEQEEQAIVFLRHKLDHWYASSESTEVFDEAVRALVIASIAETNARRVRRAESVAAPWTAP